MTKRVAACLILALVVVGGAAAARGDPQERFTRADQARAKAMLLRKSDFVQGWKASKPSDEEVDFYCTALDESDLVLTGEGESLDFEQDRASRYLYAGSVSYIYKTEAQSAESWRRSTNAAGLRCAARGFEHVAREEGGRFVSLRRIAFPRLAPQTVAYRVTLKVAGVPMILDTVMMQDGRAQAGPLLMGGPSAFPRSEAVRLAKLVAERMAEAMNGA